MHPSGRVWREEREGCIRTAELVVGKGAGNGSGPSRRMELMLAADGTLVRQVAEVEVRSAPVVGDSRVAV